MRKSTRGTLLALVSFATVPAQAAPTDVVFKGGAVITSTTGCTGWNPATNFFVGTYWVPVAGSTNGPDSVINFLQPGGGGEGFQLDNGVFNATFKAVHANHIYTRIGTYDAFVRVTGQSPAVILTTTTRVTVVGSVKGWDNTPTCIANFTMNLVRDLQP
jgi:hypothetical protein